LTRLPKTRAAHQGNPVWLARFIRFVSPAAAQWPVAFFIQKNQTRNDSSRVVFVAANISGKGSRFNFAPT
jgi:hypothetical protein